MCGLEVFCCCRRRVLGIKGKRRRSRRRFIRKGLVWVVGVFWRSLVLRNVRLTKCFFL